MMSDPSMKRRTFLHGAAALPLAALAGPAFAQAAIPRRKLDRLSLSSSTYRANYDGRRPATATPHLSHTSFPQFVKDRFGLHQIELWDQQFGPDGATVEACRQVRAAADAAGVSILSVEVESLPNLGPADPAAQAEAVAAVRAWLDKGRILGARSIRVNVSRRDDPVDMAAAVRTLRAGADYGRSIGLRLLLENHGGVTASIPTMIALVKAVNHPYCRIEVDWGAWSPPGDRYADIKAAMPLVYIVSAKGEVFDEATYEHTSFDIARLVREAESTGYRGVYSIELYGTPPPQDTDRAVRSFIKIITDNMR